MLQAPPAAVTELPAPSPDEPAALIAQREQIRRLLDCPPTRGDEVVVCGRRRGGPAEPYRQPLPGETGEQPAGRGAVGVEIAPGVRAQFNTVTTRMGPANAISVKVKF